MNKTEKIIKKIAATAGALAILTLTFFAGFFTRYYTLNKDVRNFIWVMDKIKANYYGDVLQDELYDFSLKNLQGKLDPYYSYYSKEDYQRVLAEQQGEKSGFGITVYKNEDQKLAIFLVSGNSPAERAGLTRGDIITGMAKSGQEIETVSDYESGYIKLLSIPPNEDWDIVTNSKTVTLKKEVYEEGCVYYGDSDGYFGFQGSGNNLTLTQITSPSELLDIDQNSAYIKLTTFVGKADTQFEIALEKFKDKGKSKLILDLRNNGGGYMNILMNITEHLVQSTDKPLYAAIAENKKGQKAAYPLTNSYYDDYGFEKIVVLANENTASASECLIGAMIDYGTITYDDIFISKHIDNPDAKTHGKGVMQTTFSNASSGTAVTITTAGIKWPVSEISIHKIGIGGIAVETYQNKPIYIIDNELTAAINALS